MVELLIRKLFKYITILILLLYCSNVAAERVFVKSYSGEQGHAWLFGARGESGVECWLAVPLHVISGNDLEAFPFIFTDKSGRSGQSATPIPISTVKEALEAAEGISDLAFALVDSGRNKGECLSRLGLPKYSYDSLIRSSPELIIFSMLPTSYGIFMAVVNRAGTKSDGGLVDIRPISQGDVDKYIKQGISGSVAEIQRGEETLPFAMVLKADPVGGTLRALRFDLIRAAFVKVKEAYMNPIQYEVSQANGIQYKIVEFKGTPLSSSIGPNSLFKSGECLHIAPSGGSENITIIIELVNPQDKILGLIISQSDNCGNPPLKYFIEQRIPKVSDWVTAASCTTTSDNEKSSTCRMDLRGPRQLRITFNTTKPIALSQLTIY